MATVNMDRLLQACVTQGASDLHLVVGRPPVLRIDGSLRSLETKVLESDDTTALMKSITPDKNQQELQEEGGTDYGFAYGDEARFRVSVFRQKGNLSLVLRRIPTNIMTFEEIGLPKICAALCRRPRGMFLVTGPTGCGKTTTLATMINYINENLDRHIITVEEPIEYYHSHKKSIVNQRAVGVDVPSFGEALRRVLRMDPDVILVGELRDLETIESAVRAAETGHLVFATVHTTSAAGTITRLIDVFPVDQQEQIRIQLSSNLIAVLSQALCPLATGRGRIA
ncbi:MAG: PilT/PilU family type 4a pilus ATPase, partial [Planctomycetes bacterium]|nr:PilT/PilU family type 4a pilus ATPase [Planctomycetota bacterium]